jgi:hypothetical protein
MQWLPRTIAILILMAGPGLLGSLLDSRLGTSFLAPLGSLLGIGLATSLLLILAKKLTPPARGKPLGPDDDLIDNDLIDNSPPKQSDDRPPNTTN